MIGLSVNRTCDASLHRKTYRPGLGLVAWCLFLAGCTTVLHPYNQRSEAKLRVESPIPQAYTIQVADNKSDYQVPADGLVILEIPELDRGCAMFLFGLVKVRDSRAEDVPAIQVSRNGRSVLRFSLNDLAKLPVDGEGCRQLRLK